MTRYWVSWWSNNPINDETPFTWWDTGTRFEPDGTSYCASIDSAYDGSAGEAWVWGLVYKHFPDAEQRFCEPRAADWTPGDRFR